MLNYRKHVIHRMLPFLLVLLGLDLADRLDFALCDLAVLVDAQGIDAVDPSLSRQCAVISLWSN